MVNNGVSRACRTCKQRHKKCDEVRPICSRCLKSKKQCLYDYESESDLLFRNSGFKLSLPNKSFTVYQQHGDQCSSTESAFAQDEIVCSSEVDQGFDRDVLLQDFLHGFCIISKDHSLSRGYLDGLPALLEHINNNTNLAKAANAAALSYAGMKHQRKTLLVEAERAYASLLRSFRKAIAEIEESTCIVTFMTTVLLGLYEILTATDTSPGAQNVHLQGLSAILSAAGSPFNLLGGLRAFSMANSLPVKLPTPHLTASLATILEASTPTAVQNLDVTVCKLGPILSQGEALLSIAFPGIESLHTLFARVDEIEQEMNTWGNRQVNEWQTQTLMDSAPENCCRGRLMLWPGHIETYYDLYVASVWNTYRKCHILILDMKWRCAQKIQAMLSGNSNTSSEEQVHMRCRANKLANALASTVPFHLTNLSILEEPSSANTDEIERKLQEVGRPVGGLLLMHPMYVVNQMSIVDEEMRRYARRTLEWIGKEMGIGEAIVLANEKSQIPFQYAAKGHILVWAGMLIQSPFICSGIRAD